MAMATSVANATPNAATMDSAASSLPRKLAAETLATRLTMVKVCALDVPPPGAGVNTVTLAVPAVAMSEAGIAAVNCVALTNVVVRALPFHCTIEALVKFVPLTVKVNATPPATPELGLIAVVVGAGAAALIVKVTALDVPPPGVGLKTVTLAVPAEAMSEAGIAAVSCVALTKVVVRALPFQRTVEPLMKFDPLTVNVKAAPPAVAEVGLMVVIAGTGFCC